MLTFVIAIIIVTLLVIGIDKFVTYGKENDLYKSGYLNED